MSIQSEINRIAGAKSDIADAIEDKGVTVPSGTKLDGMANLIGQISGGSEKLNSTQAADAYDPTATYAVGDKVSYAGNVYSCISAISTPEAWDSTHWDQVDPIQDQVDEVRNTVNQLDQNMAYVESGNTASRTYIAGDFISWKGTLYKASTAIPASTAFAVGTNLSAVVDGNNVLCGGLNSLKNTFHPVVSPNAGSHNSIYRGKNLGSSVTAAQYAEIDAGTFNDLFIGDYWVINNVNWRIAAFDYWVHYGDTECTTHHVVIVPDSSLANTKMNNSNVTTGAYLGSDFYTGSNSNTGRSTMDTAINNAFGSAHILSHREYLKDAVTNGYESGGTWVDSTAELMTEQMVYGCQIFGNVICGTNMPTSYTTDYAQLPLFALDHSHICNRGACWLRDVVSSAYFAYVSSYGYATYGYASYSLGIRPAFAIKA